MPNAHQLLVAPVVLVALPVQPLRQQLERHETHTSDHRSGAGRGARGGRGARASIPQGKVGRRDARERGDGRAGTGGHRPGTAPAPAPAPAAERRAVRGGAGPGARPLHPRPPPATPGGGGDTGDAKSAAARGPALTWAALRHGPADRYRAMRKYSSAGRQGVGSSPGREGTGPGTGTGSGPEPGKPKQLGAPGRG